ncbi:MAG: T9SS type A sorting domain-containing protein [candidate division WOR-3 bacterium]
MFGYIIAATIGLSAEPAKVENPGIPGKDELRYHSLFEDGRGWIINWTSYPAYVGVRFRVPLSGGNNAIRIDSVMVNYRCYTTGTKEDTLYIYDDATGPKPGNLIRTIPFQFSINTAGWYVINVPDGMDTLYKGATDTVFLWTVQTARKITGDTIKRGTDSSNADPYTTGYNYYSLDGSTWNDFYGAIPSVPGIDWVYTLWYSPLNVDVAELPSVSHFFLQGVSPNPVRGRARVSFGLPTGSHVDIAVYDAGGRRVMTAFSGDLGPGGHSVPLELGGLSEGVYFLNLRAGTESSTAMFIVK